MIRMSEIHLRFREVFDESVLTELFSIVVGYSLSFVLRDSIEDISCSFTHILCGSPLKFSCKQVSGLSLHIRKDYLVRASFPSNDCISLPVSNMESFLDDFWPSFNHSSIHNSTLVLSIMLVTFSFSSKEFLYEFSVCRIYVAVDGVF